MNSKIFWGLVIVVLSLFKFIPEDIMKYIVNYQVVMILVGAYFLVKKKKHGWIFLGIGVYLYITSYVWEAFTIIHSSIDFWTSCYWTRYKRNC